MEREDYTRKATDLILEFTGADRLPRQTFLGDRKENIKTLLAHRRDLIVELAHEAPPVAQDRYGDSIRNANTSRRHVGRVQPSVESGTRCGRQEARGRSHRLEGAKSVNARDEWIYMHKERLLAEGNFVKPAKADFLATPRSNVDHHVDLYTRDDLSARRPGPSPVLVERAKARPWSAAQKLALVAGLEEWAGDNVYGKLFRQYCRPNGVLNGFNVTEIVTMAALLRELMVTWHQDNGKDVPEWVKGIPVWIDLAED